MGSIEKLAMNILGWILFSVAVIGLLLFNIYYKEEAWEMNSPLSQISSMCLDILMIVIISLKLKIEEIIILPSFTITLLIVVINLIIAIFYLLHGIKSYMKGGKDNEHK